VDGTSGHGAAQEVRGLFQNAGGKSGKAAWMFDDVWRVAVSGVDKVGEDGENEIIDLAIGAGATDVLSCTNSDSGDDECEDIQLYFMVDGRQSAVCVRDAIAAHNEGNILSLRTERNWRVREERKAVDNELRIKLLRLFKKLDQRADVVSVFHNADVEQVGEVE
jgi:transcriptional/translational regulatory protein YebC/TACO1